MPTTRPTLLVVDDEPSVLQSVHDLLRIDYEVLTREDGPSALDVLASSPDIAVVMSDQRMPGMSGVEMLRQAKTLRPETTRLLCTAYADIKAVGDAINQGCVYRFVTKPWEAAELQTVIRQAVEKHDLLTEKNRLLDQLKQTNERLLEAARLKGAFIETASHELNTPVAVLLGMTQLWKLTQDETASPTERNWVDRIDCAGRRLATVVERMVKLTRCEGPARPLDLKSVALEPLIRGVVAELEPFLSARRQRVAFELADGLGEAEVDAGKLTDILTNLVMNAIKFTADDGTIRVTAAPDGPDHVRLSVIDQGIGIDPTIRPYVFEPFFAGFDTMHHSSGDFEYCKRGMGLGLTVVKRFVELHGGRIDVKSLPGEGTTFSVTLPRRAKA